MLCQTFRRSGGAGSIYPPDPAIPKRAGGTNFKGGSMKYFGDRTSTLKFWGKAQIPTRERRTFIGGCPATKGYIDIKCHETGNAVGFQGNFGVFHG